MPGYLLIGEEDAWSEANEEQLLPDSWFTIARRGRSIKREFRSFIPRRLVVEPEGTIRARPNTLDHHWLVPARHRS